MIKNKEKKEKLPIKVSIKLKLILVIIPLIITAVFITGFFAVLSARAGITRIAIDALAFKSLELEKYTKNQWSILVQNGLNNDERFIQSAKLSILSYSKSLLQSNTELIFAIDIGKDPLGISIQTRDISLSAREQSTLLEIIQGTPQGWVEFPLQEEKRVGHSFYFEPFNWYFFVTEQKKTFFAEANGIILQSVIIAGISLVVAIILSIFFISYIATPIKDTVQAMLSVIKNNDLSARVKVASNDEFGQMAHTFNIMTEELSKAYSQIKSYAFQATLAKKTETKIRNIFQKYVPNSVIENIFENPERMLVGENRTLTVMFTDIRSFTSISEGMQPKNLITALNQYFSIMVDIISKHGGITDKYIGDAIMAIFGAPNKLPNSALNALETALDMVEALRKFNATQKKKGMPEFITGIGLSHGPVTVGNIGSEKKMDYTVIGDTVNLGSRLESLNKIYKVGVIFPHPIFQSIEGKYPCRFIDTVVVRGKTMGEKIYTAQKKLTEKETQAWNLHHQGMREYYQRKFKEAVTYFKKVKAILPNDVVTDIFIERAKKYTLKAPPKNWVGIETLS